MDWTINQPWEVYTELLDEEGRPTGAMQFDSRWSNKEAADRAAYDRGGIVL